MWLFNKKTEIKKQPAVEAAKVNDAKRDYSQMPIRPKFSYFGEFFRQYHYIVSKIFCKIFLKFKNLCLKEHAATAPKSAIKIETEVKSMKDLYGTVETGKAKLAVKRGEKRSVSGQAYNIIMKPLITEKVSGLGALNKYVFAVAKNSNKIEVAKAIKEIYGLKPIGVNVIRMSGKKARYGRISGRRKDWKKAIVTLPQGQTIKIYEGV